ncbi:hypothetical protein [Natribacillus halophilus]|nr:hypothetical protein [Natribacillus halophilus]
MEQSVKEINNITKNIEQKQENQEAVIDLLSRRSIDLEVGLKKVR